MSAASTGGRSGKPVPADRTLAEDLLLVLFQPGSGTIAGETTLSSVLAGAVLAELGLGGHVHATAGRLGSTTVSAVPHRPPADRLLRDSWEYVSDRARGVQTVLPATGPTLREPLLDRLVERGDLRRSTRRTLGLFSVTALEEGTTGRRQALLTELRAVLVDGGEAAPRVAALAALLYASGALPQLHPDVPWTSRVIARAAALQDGQWEAGAAAEAVGRTVMAYLVSVTAAASRP